MRQRAAQGKARGASADEASLWIAGMTFLGRHFAFAALAPVCENTLAMGHNTIASITLDEATIIARNADIESERAVAMRDLVADNTFAPSQALARGQVGPWALHLSVIDGRLAVALRDASGTDAGTIGLGMARLRRVIRDYFGICDSYYKALRKATAMEIETLDMARRAIHDRGTRALLDILEGKIETDFDTARRLFTLICVLHTKS
jgi:uncharacterized protein (UPF0262 family)